MGQYDMVFVQKFVMLFFGCRRPIKKIFNMTPLSKKTQEHFKMTPLITSGLLLNQLGSGG